MEVSDDVTCGLLERTFQSSFGDACLGHDFSLSDQTHIQIISSHGLVVVIRFNSGSCHGVCSSNNSTTSGAGINTIQGDTKEECFTRQRLRSTIRFLRKALDNDETHSSNTRTHKCSSNNHTRNTSAKRNTHTLRPFPLRLNRAAIRKRRSPRHFTRSPVPTPNVLPSSLRSSILLPIPRRQVQRHLPLRRTEKLLGQLECLLVLHAYQGFARS